MENITIAAATLEEVRSGGAAKLETFEWQAPAFYRKHGYEEYARIDDYASGFYLSSMKKTLEP